MAHKTKRGSNGCEFHFFSFLYFGIGLLLILFGTVIGHGSIPTSISEIAAFKMHTPLILVYYTYAGLVWCGFFLAIVLYGNLSWFYYKNRGKCYSYPQYPW